METKHDIILSLAVGNSRKTKKWKNRQIKWSELLDKLSTTTRTSETVAEYKAMSRDRQSDIKDVGGFVGGYCAEGSRSDVTFRSVLTLDADYADSELWSDWELVYGKMAAVYSTHKHTEEKPRLRLVVPLSRNVDPDEYQAVGRKVAETLGIDKFDDSSYQPQRVMYWPSTSQDGVFFFDYCDAEPLNPDEVLSTYHNWRDVSNWPMSSRVAEVAKKTAAKQQDPEEKNGLVGAFCRAYSITEAIEAFIPTYQPCDEAGRYTYTEGSTAAGVIVYDDKFSYSHHATDPASMQLCNSWDLVRLHKFGELDEGADPDTAITKRKSYKAMTAFALEDSRVKNQLLEDKRAEAIIDFDEPIEDENAEDWRTKLQMTEKGGLAQTIGNAALILSNAPEYKGAIAYNEMDAQIVVKGSLPWREVNAESAWSDADDAQLRLRLEQQYGLSSKDKITDALNTVAQANKFHPVREYLDSCTWDGVQRIETLLIDYLGAEDNIYTRTVTRKTLVAAVARIYRPGVKFDYMLTLRGQQGLGKSSFIGRLGGEWYSDTFTTMQGKEAYEQIRGSWIIEVGELAGMRLAEVETIKLFISKQRDRYRPAYGRRVQDFPRQCIFIGTTNETAFLRDNTGNRRFWVVDTPNEPQRDFWEELTPETVRSIWAEAIEYYRRGEKLYLPPDVERLAREAQETYKEENPKAGLVAEYLDRLLPTDWKDKDLYDRRQWLESDNEGTEQRQTVSTIEIWAEALSGNPDKLDRYAVKEIGDILSGFPEWVRQSGNSRITVKPYGKQRYYKRRTAE